MRTLKIIIAGSRNFDDYVLLKEETDAFLARLKVVENLTDEDEFVVVSGGARGTDKLGERYAKERGYHCEIYPADWSIGKQAGILRNIRMGDLSDACIVFNLDSSKGSAHMINYARKKGLSTYEVKCFS